MTFLTAQVYSACTMVSYGEACSSVEGNQGLKYEAKPVSKKQSTEEVVTGNFENSPSESEVLDGHKLDHSGCGILMPFEFPPREDFKHLGLSLPNTLSSGRDDIIKRILRKYGDISRGSMLKSVEAKTAFLQLVAEVAERLHSHTLDTIDAHELQVVQKLTDDAAAVGFNVNWLQQRITNIVKVSKYQDTLMRLNDISEKINVAKVTLLEMELQQMILKKEIDSMKAEMDSKELCRSNLCEGLF